MQTEIETKFYPVDRDDSRARLERAGFTLASPEFMMTRVTFAPPVPDEKTWARVRHEGGKITMSIKRVEDDSMTGTKEAQVSINSFDSGGAFLEAAGFRRKSFQETLREIWTRGDDRHMAWTRTICGNREHERGNRGESRRRSGLRHERRAGWRARRYMGEIFRRTEKHRKLLARNHVREPAEIRKAA